MKKKMAFHILILTILILSILNISVQPFMVSAYGSGSSSSGDAHDWITDEAIEVLSADQYSIIAAEMNTYADRMKEGSYDADHKADLLNLPLSAANHYHDADTHIGLLGVFEAAGKGANRAFAKALEYYCSGDKDNAYYAFGVALHLLQDQTVPHHATCQMFNYHEAYEDFIKDNKKSVITNVDSGGLYTFSSKSGHYNDETPFGWVDRAAHYGAERYYQVNGPDNTGDKDWDAAAYYLLPRAVKLSAGFMRFFYECANQGRRELSLSSSLSGDGAEFHYTKALPYGTHNIILAGDSEENFDLYVKWGGTPTTLSSHARGESGEAMEYVTTRSKGVLHIMVRSYRGAGQFKLYIIYGLKTAYSVKSGWVSKSVPAFPETKTFSVYGTSSSGRMHGWIFLAGPDTCDFDLYLRWKYSPSTSTYDSKDSSFYSQACCNKVWTGSSTNLYGMVRAYRGTGYYRMLFLIFDTPNY